MKKSVVGKIIVFVFLFLLWNPDGIKAAQEESYLGQLTEQMDFSGLDAWMKERKEKITFSELFEELLTKGIEAFDYTKIFEWLWDMFFFELEANRTLLTEVILLSVGFSILCNFSNAFRTSYISKLCFLLVYCVLAVLLLRSFLTFRDIVMEGVNGSVEFMQALLPSLSLAMVFSAGAATSAALYQMGFLVIYLVQWFFLKILMPCIHGYVILELFNHFFEDEKFQNMAELLKSFVSWSMKLAFGAVLGLNVVQGLLSPAKDRLAKGTVGKAVAAIPGIGNVLDGVGELLLGSGILIKNCVGVAALIALLAVGVIPLLKLACMAFFYKLSAAITEPVTDKRIAGCLKGMAEGGMLYLKLICCCMALFFLTIALTTAASGFIY
ncbi:MAG: stage III sporulation protein AE [Clostridiales bacterium]|nr:stage III sporulation protein AE [Clostridiales bacterium]